MNRLLKDRLVSMAARDLEVRERLASDGSLFNGYHPEMQAVHEENAGDLERILVEGGWPTPDLVGDEGAEAAWLIAQHAIGLPKFQRRCLELLKAAVAEGKAPAWQMAMMVDRIRTFEGRPQLFGTSFDWDEDGHMSPRPIEDPDGVDRRRADVGLQPLVDAVARHRAGDAAERKPTDLVGRAKRMKDWAREVGWR